MKQIKIQVGIHSQQFIANFRFLFLFVKTNCTSLSFNSSLLFSLTSLSMSPSLYSSYLKISLIVPLHPNDEVPAHCLRRPGPQPRLLWWWEVGWTEAEVVLIRDVEVLLLPSDKCRTLVTDNWSNFISSSDIIILLVWMFGRSSWPAHMSITNAHAS